MNKQAIITILNQHGIKYSADMTKAELEELLPVEDQVEKRERVEGDAVPTRETREKNDVFVSGSDELEPETPEEEEGEDRPVSERKAEFKRVIERYKERNPKKYEEKKEALQKQLHEMK